MNGKFHILKAITANVFFIPLLLAIGIGSAGQPVPVRAAPPDQAGTTVTVTRSLKLRYVPKGTFCSGDSATIGVDVVELRQFERKGKKTNTKSDVIGNVKILGDSLNPDVGTITPPTADTDEYLVSPTTVGQADFTFTAKKPGTTTINFTALLPDEAGGGTLQQRIGPIKVVECQYRILAISLGEMHIPPALGMDVQLFVAGTVKRVPETEDVYRGEATVVEAARMTLAGSACASSYVYDTTKTNLFVQLLWNAQQNKYDAFKVEVPSYDLPVKESVVCPRIARSGQGANTAAPIDVQVELSKMTADVSQSPLWGFSLMQGLTRVRVVRIVPQ